jgi:hypothetical protein
MPDNWKANFLVASPLSANVTLESVKVLLVKVSVPAKVAKVPVVGKVTLVAPPEVNVIAPDPAVVKFCPKVKVPVVHVGAPAPPDNKARPDAPGVNNSKLSPSE